jgi:hypothetical protein
VNNRCEHTDLLIDECAHCLGHHTIPAHVSAFYPGVGFDPDRAVRVVPLPEYSGALYGTVRSVKVGADSKERCQVAGCLRPSPQAFVCGQCLDELEVALMNVPVVIEDLAIATTRQSRFSGPSSTHGRTEAPLPYETRSADAWASLSNAVTSSARLLCEHRGLTMPSHEAVSLSRWLLANLAAIGQDVAGGDIATEIIGNVAHGQRVIDRPEDRVYIGLCRLCQTPMHADLSAFTYRCSVCTSEYEIAATREALFARVRETIATVGEMVLLADYIGVKVKRSRVEKMVERGRLVRAGQRVDGVATYRLGDLLSLIEDRKEAS